MMRITPGTRQAKTLPSRSLSEVTKAFHIVESIGEKITGQLSKEREEVWGAAVEEGLLKTRRRWLTGLRTCWSGVWREEKLPGQEQVEDLDILKLAALKKQEAGVREHGEGGCRE